MKKGSKKHMNLVQRVSDETKEESSSGVTQLDARPAVQRTEAGSPQQVVGVLQPAEYGGEVFALSGSIKGRVRIPAKRMNGAPLGMMVLCALSDPLNPDDPTGEVIEVLGEPERPDVALEAIYRAHDLRLDFPPAVQRAAARCPTELTEERIAEVLSQGRRDLRGLGTLTIDGLDAKDLDDALSLECEPDGRRRLYVHIADVSEYVREDGALDREAVLRGTSVYPVDRVIPMLPTRLSNGICSLNPNQPRLALTVILEYDAEGERVGGEVCESVICSDLRGDYPAVWRSLQAQRPEPGYEELWPMLRELATLARQLSKRRREEGRIDFHFAETHVDLDAEGHPIGIGAYETNFANQLIEECMVAANEWVAEHFCSLSAPFLYRVHDAPDPEKLDNLLLLCRQIGLSVPSHLGQKPAQLAQVLEAVHDLPEGPALETAMLRAMAKAEYRAENQGHYGLALQNYCHFTSPIRRYPDLFIHRVIKGYLRGQVRPRKWRALAPERAVQCSVRERVAMAVERETTEQKVVEYMAAFVGETYKGRVTGFCGAGFFVALENTAEGMVPFRSLPDYFVYQEERLCAVGRQSGVVLHIGQEVEVRVARADVVRRQLDFALDEGDAFLNRLRGSRHKGSFATGSLSRQERRKGMRSKRKRERRFHSGQTQSFSWRSESGKQVGEFEGPSSAIKGRKRSDSGKKAQGRKGALRNHRSRSRTKRAR